MLNQTNLSDIRWIEYSEYVGDVEFEYVVMFHKDVPEDIIENYVDGYQVYSPYVIKMPFETFNNIFFNDDGKVTYDRWKRGYQL